MRNNVFVRITFSNQRMSIQSIQKSCINESEDVFGRLSICWEAFDLWQLVVASGEYLIIPTNDPIRMCNRASSAKVCTVKLVRPISMWNTYRPIYLVDLSLHVVGNDFAIKSAIAVIIQEWISIWPLNLCTSKCFSSSTTTHSPQSFENHHFI